MPIFLQGVTKRFRSHLALDAVDIHVRRGDRYGFIGHNGAGKTTALRIALGLVRPEAGQVRIDGHDPWSSPRVRSLVGGLIERPGFHDSLSGRKNLQLLAALQAVIGRERSAEVDRVLELVGMQDAADKRVGQYSQGMRQRLGLAQALLGSPQYLLLDEPTNGLDPEGIHELRRLLIRLSEEEGMTILLSSHLLQEVADLCNRVGVLRDGKMLLESTTAELLAGDATAYRLVTDDNLAAGEALRAAGIELGSEPGGFLHLGMAGEDPSRAVEILVHAGCKVRSFTPVENSLEEIYLAHARGKSESGADAESRAPGEGAVDLQQDSPSAADGFLWAFFVSFCAGFRICRYELSRLARPGTLVALFLPAVIAAIAVYQDYAAAVREAGEVSGGELFSATGVTAYSALGSALLTTVPLLALVMIGIASQSLAGQIREGSLRNLLTRPFHRFEIALGKFAALCVVACLAYLGLLASASLAAGIAFDYGDLVEMLSTGAGSFPLLTAKEVDPELWPALRSACLPLLAWTALGFLVSSLTRSSAAGLSLSLGLFVILELCRAPAEAYGFEELLLGPYLPSPLAANSHLDYFTEFASGVSNSSEYFAATAKLVPALWILLCAAIAILSLRRKYLP